MSDVKRDSSHLVRPRSLPREQRTIEEADDPLFVLGGTLVDRLRVVDVEEIPEFDRLTRSLRADEVELALELPAPAGDE
ncbi:MAG TPA: hypothetical protein VFX49_10250 [Chloroflexota bacterium]|nr:hypothetical protein [Chloroflexota bacterium]